MKVINSATCVAITMLYYALTGFGDAQDIPRNSSSSTENETCDEGRFQCLDGKCIEREQVCDGSPDCSILEDETMTNCLKVNRTCSENSFQCTYGACISESLRCNGVADCVDGSDEDSESCVSVTRNTKDQPVAEANTTISQIDQTVSCRAPPHPTGGKWTVSTCNLLDENCNPPVGTSLAPGTILSYTCSGVGLILSGPQRISCSSTGKWTSIPQCVACGVVARKILPSRTGANVDPLPWHATLYKAESPSAPKKIICGATIVRPDRVLTAAHCVYNDLLRKKEPAEKFYIAAGQFYPEYDSPLNDPKLVRKSKVKEIHIKCNYLGVRDNYASDIAILVLEESFEFTASLLPVCLDIYGETEEMDLKNGSFGYVAGFGGILGGQTNVSVHTIMVPYVPTNQCKRFTDSPQFITGDKFCTGCLNETLGYGDGGSGMVFPRLRIGYLRGIVSLSLGVDSGNGEQKCDKYSFFLSTRISDHIRWIQEAFSQLDRNQEYNSCREVLHAEPPLVVFLPPATSTTLKPTVSFGSFQENDLECLNMSNDTSLQAGCSLEVFLCNGESCTKKRFECDDLFPREFGSDKKKMLCRSKSQTLTGSNNDNMTNLCTIPPKLPNTSWEPVDCMVDETCEVKIGLKMKPGSVMHLRCDPGFAPSEPTKIFCSTEGQWLNVPYCTEIRCPQLTSVSTVADCTLNETIVTCDSTVAVSTRARVSCRNGYKRDIVSITTQREDVLCDSSGRWVPEPIRCIPACGVPAARAVPLIVDGELAKLADFPWHATLYQEGMDESEKNFICGATIIRPDLLVTAAHCVYDESARKVQKANRFWVATGNIFQGWDESLHDPQVVRKAQVKKIYVNCKYLGLPGNYDLDIALMELKHAFEFSALLRPICLDHSAYGDRLALEVGNEGRVAGFGRTASGPTSYILQTTTLPYVSYSECKRSSVDTDIEKFITYGKFCAGYKNGTAVCDGDSGGGLVFKMGDLWYLRGIVSTSLGLDTMSGDRSCDKFSYSLYTRVSNHIEWIQDVMLHLETKVPYPSCSTD